MTDHLTDEDREVADQWTQGPVSADLTARLAALLGEHWTAGMAANGAARKWECACGERIAMSDAAHRAHVAAVLAEAGVGFVAEAADRIGGTR